MIGILRVSSVVGAALVMFAGPAAADDSVRVVQPGPVADGGSRIARPQPNSKGNPYARLFEVPGIDAAAARQRALEAISRRAKPAVVCGMTLIPIDPSIDPKIYVEPRAGDTRYTIRAVPPPMCKQD